MYFVYILKSKKSGKLYTGYTINLESRIKRHLSGNVLTTKRLLPIELSFMKHTSPE